MHSYLFLLITIYTDIYLFRFLVPVVATAYLFAQMAQIIEERSDETIIVHGYAIHLKGSLRRYYSRRFSG